MLFDLGLLGCSAMRRQVMAGVVENFSIMTGYKNFKREKIENCTFAHDP